MGKLSFNRPSPYVINFPDGDHIGEEILRRKKPYEYFAIRALTQLTRSGDVIIDVGANIGNHTLYWAASGRQVVAFEPNPNALKWLQLNVRMNNFPHPIDVRPYAVGNGALTFGTISAVQAGNLGATVVEGDPQGTLQFVTLDDSISGPVGAIKIDIEGHEVSAIQGAKRLLADCSPFLMIEAWDKQALRELTSELAPLGYHRSPLRVTPIAYLYCPGVSGLVRSLLTPSVAHAALRAKAGQCKGLIKKSFTRVQYFFRSR